MVTQAAIAVTPDEARAIAKEAYIYGFPLVDNMRIHYRYFVDRGDPEYKAPYNQLFNIPRVYTPEDKAIQTPNSDTPYSWIGLDLRTEPIVFTVPPIEKGGIGACNWLTCTLTTSMMLPHLKRDDDQGLTLYIQNESPGKDKGIQLATCTNGPVLGDSALVLAKSRSAEWHMETTTNAMCKGGMIMQFPNQTDSSEVSGTLVTQENYCRAETDRAFTNGLKLSGGVNRWLHFRNLTPLDQQTVVRMNKDTLYSTALVDTSKGATLAVPKLPEERYFSVLMVDNDHYAPGVIY